MKRSFAYLVLALVLSLLLCACGDSAGRGVVTASPWPDVTTPPLPSPTAEITASPMPELMPGDNTAGMDNGMTDNGASGMTTSSPAPTDNMR